MGLNLSSIHQRPFVQRDEQGYIKKHQEDEMSKSAGSAQREEQTSQNARSRGLQYIDNGADEFTRTPVAQSTDSVPVNVIPHTYIPTTPAYNNVNVNSAFNTYANISKNVSMTAEPRNVQPSPQVNYGNVKTTINIAQILKDFNNTAVAIGTPEELKEEVRGYLDLIEKQVVKDEPNVRLIKSNLKNASTILDNYISETLNKDSKVVENWVDALFMQDVNFKYDENDINEQFLVKFPEKTENPDPVATGQTENIDQSSIKDDINPNEAETISEHINNVNIKENEQTKVFIPQDSELKSLFLQSKRLAYAHEPKKALETFEKALERANEVGDAETKSKIYYEIGKIYDDIEYPAQALKSYHKSLDTTDMNIKTKAHYSMAQIYDEVNQIEPALEHYFVSVGYGGESDNIAAQSTSLAKMGNIYSDMYEDDAFEYLNVAKELADEIDNSKVKGYVSSSLGRAYERFGEPKEALNSYADAVKNYTDAESPIKAAQNYLAAAEIMIGFSSNNKARGLLNKAQKYATKANDEALLNEINNRLNKLAA